MPRFGYSNTLVGIKRIDFDANPPAYAYRQGRVAWDALDLTLAIMQNDGVEEVVNQIGQEQSMWVRNDTLANIANGAAVYVTGTVGNRPSIANAQANAIATAGVRGIATQTIGTNDNGFITVFGLVRDINTNAWNEGDYLYLSPTTPGGLTNTPPTSGYNVRVGLVLKKSTGAGVIFVCPDRIPVFGNVAGGNYTAFEFDGTMIAVGNATCYRDELQSVTGAQIDSPAGDFERIVAEASVRAKTSASYPTDYITGNWQLNHDWALGTSIYPHLHWWQTTANTPNWIFAYRWQKQGSVRTSAWSNVAWTANGFTWTAGTLNQITAFGAIAAPVGYGQVSDIIQFRLYRDYTNVSGLFGAGDPVAANQDIINIDAHIQIDTLGSRQEYIK